MTKILVVDDNLFELNGLCKLLEGWGFSVHGASNGLEALETMQRENFDLLLTDVWMPRMTGLELLQRLPKSGQPRAIVMTGDEETEIKLRQLAYEYIMKPLNPQRLLEMITRTLMPQAGARRIGSAL